MRSKAFAARSVTRMPLDSESKNQESIISASINLDSNGEGGNEHTSRPLRPILIGADRKRLVWTEVG
jgi:hypothetical protein